MVRGGLALTSFPVDTSEVISLIDRVEKRYVPHRWRSIDVQTSPRISLSTSASDTEIEFHSDPNLCRIFSNASSTAFSFWIWNSLLPRVSSVVPDMEYKLWELFRYWLILFSAIPLFITCFIQPCVDLVGCLATKYIER